MSGHQSQQLSEYLLPGMLAGRSDLTQHLNFQVAVLEPDEDEGIERNPSTGKAYRQGRNYRSAGWGAVTPVYHLQPCRVSFY